MVVSFDTQLSADSVEFCPIDGWTRFAAVGTYQVLEKPADAPASATDDADAGAAAGAGAAGPGATTNRTGRLLVFQVADADADGLAAADAAPLQVTKVFEQDTAAILDIKWSHQTLSDRPVAGLVTSTGDTVLLDMAQDGRMQPISTLHNGKDGVLNLSLDWVVVSQSDGSLALHVVTPDSGISVASEWAAHSFEAWTTAFDGSNPHVVYSGGDDCLFQAWDTRTDLTAPLFRNKR
ncbi:Diphthine methyltransferase [Polyrhizophydium stewartii]|uniref:Diphthine methyltransferase n=1 Tax=Polyrhizophydium stewartii TaxID=2732419 RepID=A0ABR4NBK0_9FUNG